MSDKDVNLKSVDAMFATILARMDAQDLALKRIETQTEAIGGRVTELEKREEARRVRFTTLAAIFSGIGAGLVKLAEWIVSGPGPNP